MPDRDFPFDVFLSHNSKDKPAVEAIARLLQNEYKLKTWLDKWNLIPGDPWQQAIGEALDQCRTFAVFVGEAGMGSWENPEMERALDTRARDRQRRVVPVLLPGAPDNSEIKLPPFLSLLTWVDLRNGYDATELVYMLACGIKGIAPGDREVVSSNSVSPNQTAEHFRERFADAGPAKSTKVDEPAQQSRPSAARGAPVKLPTARDLRISRDQFTELNNAQLELKDFVDGYILFSEPWVDCGLAKSKLEEGKKRLDAKRKNLSKDVPDEDYWGDIKKHLKRARTKLSGNIPKSLGSTGQFENFQAALSGAIDAVDGFTLSKFKKTEFINEALELMEEVATAAEMIVDHLQDDAQKKLENISGLITGIFGRRTEVNQGPASVSSQKPSRYWNRSQTPDIPGQGAAPPSGQDR